MDDSARPAVFIRRVRAADAQTMRVFLVGLGAPSRRQRFHAAVKVSPALVGQLVGVDGDTHAGWVACVWGADGEEVVGEAGWYVADPRQGHAELALSVLDSWRGSGLADRLMTALVQGARDAGLKQLCGDVLDGNRRMIAFLNRHGLEEGWEDPPEQGIVRLICRLDVT